MEMPATDTINKADDVMYGDDLMLSPLPHTETEARLHHACSTSHKWALARSMSSELPGESPAMELPRALAYSPAPTSSGNGKNDVLRHLVAPPPLTDVSHLSFDMDRLEGCSIQEADLPRVASPVVSMDVASAEDKHSIKPCTVPETAHKVHTSSIWERVFSSAARAVKPTVSPKIRAIVARSSASSSAPPVARPNKKHKKRRVVKKDPNKPKPKPWSEAELTRFRKLLAKEGPNNWAAKAAKLGTNRSAKSLHTRWLREEGRIIDRPRGMAAMREQARKAQEAVAC